MSMTATLDFTPSTQQLDRFRAARHLPVYDAPEPHDARPMAARPASPAVSRPLLAIVIAAVIVIGFVVLGGDAAARGTITPASPDSAVVDATVEVYVVQPGDTLWAIAGRLAPEGADLRPIVDELSAASGGAQLQIGQRLVIDHGSLGG